MKALAAVLVVALAVPAWAADDAPLAPVDAPAVGGTLSTETLCLSPAEQLALAKRLESDKAALASLKADAGKLQPLPIILAVVVGLAAGVGIGYGISVAVASK